MDVADTILAVLDSAPSGKIAGKTRLQKTIHLLKLAKLDVGADFVISRFGPYSGKLADVAELLVLRGLIKENVEPIGVFDTFKSVYSLPDLNSTSKAHKPKLDKKHKDILSQLARYSTVELEVASTIGFFLHSGHSAETAVNKTKKMKPRKAIPPVLTKARDILAIVQPS